MIITTIDKGRVELFDVLVLAWLELRISRNRC